VSANPLVSRGTNLAQGFETFVELPWSPEGRNWPDGAAVNRAFFDWLGAHGGRRFVAYLHYMEPHDPYTPPDPPDAGCGLRPAIAKGWIRDAATQINWSHAAPLGPDEIAHLRGRYRREVAAWDAALGALVDRLASAGLLDQHDRDRDRRPRRGVPGARPPDARLAPLRGDGARAARAPRPGHPGRPARRPRAGHRPLPDARAHPRRDAPPGLGGRDLLAPRRRRAPAVLETSSGIGPDGAPVELVAVRTARWKLVETPGARAPRALRPGRRFPRARTIRGASAPRSAELAQARLARWRDATRPPPAGHPSRPRARAASARSATRK
jgi:hypothetical protein